MNSNQYICYCIQNTAKKKTYVGISNNFQRRLRQHNGEISSGARYTSGDSWNPVIILSGFINKNQVLRFEFLWKHIKSKLIHSFGLQKRIHTLLLLLQKDNEWNHLTIYTIPEIAPFLFPIFENNEDKDDNEINVFPNKICDLHDFYI
jgi:predicted GIY-YIG superfamily endonuclease